MGLSSRWLLFLGAVLLPNIAFASEFDINTVGGNIKGLPSAFKDLGTAIPKIYEVAIVIAAVVFVILFLIGGIRYLSNAGNEEATSKAKKLMVDGIIGLVLTLAAWALANFVYAQLTGREIGGGTASGGKSKATKTIDSQTSPPVIASADPNEGRFCAPGSANCATVTLTFTDSATGKPAADYRFQAEVTPPASAGLFDMFIPRAQAVASTQRSQILTTSASGQANLTAKVGSQLVIKGTDNTTIGQKTISQSVEALGFQITSVEKRQVNFKFLRSNSLEAISGYQFLIKDKTNKTIDGPLTTSVAGYQQANLPKGETVSLTTTDGVVIYSDTVPDDNGRIWTVFLNTGGRVGFRIQVFTNNEPLAGLSLNVRVGTANPVNYTSDTSGYVGPITADVGTQIVATSEAGGGTLSNCTFLVPPRNASVFPCTFSYNPLYSPPADDGGGPPATPR